VLVLVLLVLAGQRASNFLPTAAGSLLVSFGPAQHHNPRACDYQANTQLMQQGDSS
jgi:hypothetical protein